jgi:WD40 repeat protein
MKSITKIQLLRSDRNGVVNVINFKEFNLSKSSMLQQQRQNPQNEESSSYFIEDVNGLKTFVNCGESVSSLVFGSSKSQVKHKRLLHKHAKRVNTRFKLDDTFILAVGLESGKILIFDAALLSCLFVLRDHKEKIRDLKFTKNDAFQLASVSNDGTIKVCVHYNNNILYLIIYKSHTHSLLILLINFFFS